MHNIPDVLSSISGEKITTVAEWTQFRREELLNLFCEYVYGVRDIEAPENLKFTIVKETMEYGMRVKYIEGGFDDFKFPFRVYLPAKQTAAVPAFIYVMHENMENHLIFDEKGNMHTGKDYNSCLPLKDITDNGFAIAVMPTRALNYDWNSRSNFKKGIFKHVKPLKGRNKNSWGSISAWAWGVSRVVDYLETDNDINRQELCATGHSRSGKAALWAAATDQRIRLVNPNNSGCLGAAVLRGKRGEHIKNIAVSDWFCDKLKEFAEHEELLPVDQHMLLALMAPRFIYLTCSVDDEWSDPDAELLSAQLASEVYKLHGKKGLIAPDKPIVNEVYQEGEIAYHIKSGDHSQTKFDWDNLMTYFRKIVR